MPQRFHRPHFTSLIIAMLLAGVWAATGCGNNGAQPEERGRDASAPIVLGLTAPFAINQDLLREGATLAVEEINAAGGLLGGRRLELVMRDDRGDLPTGRAVANEFAANPRMVAVIGHVNSSISIPTSVIYEHAGLLMLTPASTNPAFTQQGYRLVFRMIPSDLEIGRQLAQYAANSGHRRMIIYHQSDEYGRGLATTLETVSAELDIEILDRQAWDNTDDPEPFRRDLALWAGLEADAFFLAGLLPGGAVFIREARAAGFDQPILTGNALDADEFLKIAGPAADGTVVGWVFHPDIPREEVRTFLDRFEARHKRPADSWAVQGYDAVQLLAHAIRTRQKAPTRPTWPKRCAPWAHGTV